MKHPDICISVINADDVKVSTVRLKQPWSVRDLNREAKRCGITDPFQRDALIEIVGELAIKP